MAPAVNHDVPPGPWMRRLQKSNWIWLCKEQQYGMVLFPWQPPEPGHVSGQLVLDRYDERDDGLYRLDTQVWYVGSRGEGFDGKQLVLPCEGQLSETMAEIIDRKESDLLMTLDELERRTDNHQLVLMKMNQQILFLANRLEEVILLLKKQNEWTPFGNSLN